MLQTRGTIKDAMTLSIISSRTCVEKDDDTRADWRAAPPSQRCCSALRRLAHHTPPGRGVMLGTAGVTERGPNHHELRQAFCPTTEYACGGSSHRFLRTLTRGLPGMAGGQQHNNIRGALPPAPLRVTGRKPDKRLATPFVSWHHRKRGRQGQYPERKANHFQPLGP